MYKLQGKDSTLRQLPFMEMYINWEGGNVENEQNSYDTLDKWVEKLVREKNQYLAYFRSCAEDYKKLRPQLGGSRNRQGRTGRRPSRPL